MMRCPSSLALIAGLLLIFTSIIMPIIFPVILNNKFSSKLTIAPNSEMLNKFIEPPADMHFKVWLFNITNTDGVLKGDKAILDEIGPYTYRKVQKKVNLKFNHEIGTVEFNRKDFYYFEPHLSTGKEDDVITTINPVYMTLTKRSSEDSAFRMAAQLWFSRFYSKPLMAKKAKELLFSGYEDPLVSQLYKLTKKSSFETGRFGFLYPKNGTKSLRYEIFTGEKEGSNYQSVFKFMDEEKLPYWKTERCNMINGSDGSSYPRPVTQKRVYLFSEDLFRSVYFEYEQDVYHGQLKLRRYSLTRASLANSTENSCFCYSKFTCRFSMHDVSPCKGGAPIVISTPHFYQAQPKDLKEVVGLNPNKVQHETFLEVEPNTGVTFRARKAIQVNVIFRQYGDFPLLQKIKSTIMPVLWVSDGALVPEEKANQLHDVLQASDTFLWYGTLALFFFGTVSVVFACCCFLCKEGDPKEL